MAEIRACLLQFHSLLQSEEPVATKQWKSPLCQLVNGTLAVVKEGHKESASTCELTLDLIHHAFAKIIMCPVSQHDPPGTSLIHDTDEPETQDEKDCIAMAYWVLSHILRMVPEIGNCSLCEKAKGTVIKVLQVIKPRDTHLFREITEEMTGILADLVKVEDRFYTEYLPDDFTCVIHRMKCNLVSLAGESGPNGMIDRSIIVGDIRGCTALQIAVTDIFNELAVDLCQFSDNLLNLDENKPAILWSTLCTQLQNGDYDLKMVTLRLVQKLLRYSGMPCMSALDFFMDVINCMADLLCDEQDDTIGDFAAMEVEYRLVLEMLLQANGRLDTEHQIKVVVWQCLAKGFMDCLVQHGTTRIRTVELKQLMCVVLCDVTIKLPCEVTRGFLILQSRVDLCSRFVEEIGLYTDLEYMEKFIAHTILDELPDTGQILEMVCNSEELVPVVDGKDEPLRKRRLSKSYTSRRETDYTHILEKSSVNNALLVRFNTLLHRLDEFQEDPECYIKYLEGIRAVIEIIVNCASSLHRMIQQERDETLIPGDSEKIEYVSVFNQDLFGYLAKSWTQLLTNCVTKVQFHHIATRCYLCIIKTIGAALSIQEFMETNMDVAHWFTWMVTLPWLLNEMNWIDLKPKESTKLITKIASKISENLTNDIKSTCVSMLGLFPKDVALKWRVQVLRIVSSESSGELKAAAIGCFPHLLYHSGPNANHLVHDILCGMTQDKCQEVQLALADVIGLVACVLSRKVILCHTSLEDADGPSFNNVLIICVGCDADRACDFDDNKVKPCTIDPSMFLPFFDILLTDRTDLKFSFIHSMKTIFMHVNARGQLATVEKMINISLGLLEDKDFNIRECFSQVIRDLMARKTDSDLRGLDSVIIVQMKKVLQKSIEESNEPLTQTILHTIGEMAQVAEGNLLLTLMIILLDNIISPPFAMACAVARSQITDLAEKKQMKMKSLLTEFGKDIARILVGYLHHAQMNQGEDAVLGILADMAEVFEYDNVHLFVKNCESLLLPELVMKKTSASSSIIKLFAKQLGDPNHKGPLARNIRMIYCHIVQHCQPSEFPNVLAYLEKQSEWDRGSLLRYAPHMDSELLLHLSSHTQRVIQGMKILVKVAGGAKNKDIVNYTEEDVVDFLQPKLLGILVHFDNHLNKGAVSCEERKKAYKSVISLMQLMGRKHITAVRVRIMTTLKIGLKYKEGGFPELCCKAWNCFVRIIDPETLGPTMSFVVVCLLPLIRGLPKQVSNIYNYLIVENREFTQDHYQELYFLPDIPELKDARQVIKTYIDSQGVITLHTKIENLLHGVSQESADVQILALKKLKVLLHENQLEVQRLVLQNETADPIISQIVLTLLKGCSHSSDETRGLYAEVFGELGAIDPGRLSVMKKPTKADIMKFAASVVDDNFIFSFIDELCKAFMRADERKPQDCVAFAIQEMIKVYGIDLKASEQSRGYKLWKMFSEEAQEIMEPLFYSKYLLHGRSDWSNLKKPIYGTRKGNTFHKWVCSLTGFLASRVRDDRAREVFDKCCGVIENDSKIALYLLPYVVIQVLLDGDDQIREDVLMEFETVLNYARQSDNKATSLTRQDDLSAQTVFSVLDHVTRWCRHRMHVLAQVNTARSRLIPIDTREDDIYKRVNSFVERVPLDTLAYASFNCNAITRSLMHYEQFLQQQTNQAFRHEQLDFLQKLYKKLGEPDGVTGVLAIKQSQATLHEQINVYESIGELSLASSCYDKAIQAEPNVIEYRQAMLKCRLDLGELFIALDLANGMVADRPEWINQINPYRVEAAWKLGRWDELEEFQSVEKKETEDWSVGVGRLLLNARNKDEESFSEELKLVRKYLMGPLCAASMEMGSYYRAYENIVRLQMLNELECGIRSLIKFPDVEVDLDPSQAEVTTSVPFSVLMNQWDGRLNFTQDAYRIREPILNLRRTLLTLAQQSERSPPDESGILEEIGNCWLGTAKVARECSLMQTAHSCLISATQFNRPECDLERAQWHWDNDNMDKAQAVLEKAVDTHFPDRARFKKRDNTPDIPGSEKEVCARMLLQLGRMYEKTSSLESNDIMKQYKEVKEICPSWEDAHFHLGSYYDTVMTNLLESEQSSHSKRGEFVMQVVDNFSSSLRFGNKYIYRTMPRILTLWLDFGAECGAMEATGARGTTLAARQHILKMLNSHLLSMNDSCATYQFLTAFPQLISRICHAQNSVFCVLRDIIANLLVHYPQQAMWMMMAVSKSSYPMRSSRCSDIINKAKSSRKDLNKFFNDATKLTDRLLDLCNKPVDNSLQTLSISQHFKSLLRLLNDRNFSKILLPLQRLMMPMLPTTPVSPAAHDPFPQNQIHISGIEDTVEVLPSLQKPKKVTMRGSDGKLYVMLCKPKDDLRKDARLMEFCAIVNRLLRTDREARRRNLQIRTFTVTPLNEECGMLEWVPNTTGLRHILLKLYKERGIYISGKDLKNLALPVKHPIERKVDVFVKKLLPKHPSVFSQWFLQNFQDPTSWYNARLSYCRTAAVMSMVGYILGLGDRHGENILIDSTCGECVHVDFNCLFNKGETFEYPEVVPFRLTHNMVDAMGTLGYEGVFRRACEVTLGKMREEMDSLVTVLQPFIFDPLVEWSKPAKGKMNESGEVRNEKATAHMHDIESRLKGELRTHTKPKSRGLPLSVEGQVNHLIKTATAVEKLASMYIGWAAYM